MLSWRIPLLAQHTSLLSSKEGMNKMQQPVQGRPCQLPLVLQISMRFTTFSCLSSWRILISRKAVMGNWKGEREQGLEMQETRAPLPREQQRQDHSCLAEGLFEHHCDKSLKGNKIRV